jgi:hypothetical protein
MGRDKTQLPRHVRAIDFAAARAAEVRRRPDVKSRRAFFSAAPITFRVFLSLLRVPVDEDLTTHPAKPRLNTMATSVTVG